MLQNVFHLNVIKYVNISGKVFQTVHIESQYLNVALCVVSGALWQNFLMHGFAPKRSKRKGGDKGHQGDT